MKSNEIKPLVWNNERVLTTKQIAEAYGCKEKQIR
ncbi:ORF6N domain-containing protein [[Clostridium] innocuum]|nr:ORF6N domain-containing protein [[Clostridium] innocuum]MCR0548696.1 ORF6N domain-containing protein [[Clostridium] innocuum]MCR0635111.1 ORF6N domain-containing protein [[Clostridium] innocuum]